jgi:hypothetical protein
MKSPPTTYRTFLHGFVFLRAKNLCVRGMIAGDRRRCLSEKRITRETYLVSRVINSANSGRSNNLTLISIGVRDVPGAWLSFIASARQL